MTLQQRWHAVAGRHDGVRGRRELAVTPGAVVYRNEVLELIQYAPATPNVHAGPQLIVPPQINKYYISDLRPGRSIVEYLVAGGFQVFTVSWRNPTAEQRDWNLDTYVAALHGGDRRRCATSPAATDVNLHGACSGGDDDRRRCSAISPRPATKTRPLRPR